MDANPHWAGAGNAVSLAIRMRDGSVVTRAWVVPDHVASMLTTHLGEPTMESVATREAAQAARTAMDGVPGYTEYDRRAGRVTVAGRIRSAVARRRRPAGYAAAADTNCGACWHLWSLHGPAGCTAAVWPSGSLTGDPCPCVHIPYLGGA